ncbi:MAG: 3-dehydroquinate synthase, partial [Planctomycetota bacterium]|nr:3-dehydroquinate synthase [Planctomycetota bacterium]
WIMKPGALDTISMPIKYSKDSHIVLTGFMGTGKSSLGRVLAQRWDRPFIDMDERLVQHFGMAISKVFETQGEAVFRREEARLCEDLSGSGGAVIASGGGTMVSRSNRERFEVDHLLLNLNASPKSILARLENDKSRPLLKHPDKMAAIQELLSKRAKDYQAIPLQIKTDGKSLDELATELEALIVELTALPPHERLIVPTPSSQYPIFIGRQLTEHLGTLFQSRGLHGRRVALVSNSDILGFHGDRIRKSLAPACSDLITVEVPEGEQHKTLTTIQSLYDQFLDARLDRSSLVVALGGGVVGDMAGFAAASYLRGLPFIQIPSTLLAMVDSSVGGKTGVDLPQGKNLVGAFKQPEFVVIDPDLLSTLPIEELRSGLAEVIKHAVLADSGLFHQLTEDPLNMTAATLRRAVQVKVDVVTEDPLEQGRRAILNLGHTFGHAFEQVSGFKIRHGEAVGVGMICAAQMGFDLGICEEALKLQIAALLEKAGLPIAFEGYPVDALIGAMAHDKKRSMGRMRFIVPQGLEKVDIVTDPSLEIVKRAFCAGTR